MLRIVISVVVSTLVLSNQVASSNQDRDVLEAFYAATNENGWTNYKNWESSKPLGEWHGVTTNADGRVIRLVLLNNNLAGELPSLLDGLTELQWLNLGDNQLTGQLPSSLGNLTELELLNLRGNAFSGSLTDVTDQPGRTETAVCGEHAVVRPYGFSVSNVANRN